MTTWKLVLIKVGILLVFVGISMFLTRAVWNSSLPEWLKLWILMGER